MSRVIHDTKIDKGLFPLVIQTVAQDEPAPERDHDSASEAQEEAELAAQKLAQLAAQSEEILRSTKEQARQIIAAAQRKSEEILAQSKKEGFDQGFNQGFAQGRGEGFSKGKAEAEEKMRQLRGEAQRTITQAEQLKAQLLGASEEEVVELAMTIASKVIRSHVEVKRDTVVQLAGEALERAVSAGFYTIFVNPEDVELLREFISELRRSAPGGARIHIIADGSISQGGCKVETEHGLVDMTLESQLEEIRKVLRDELEREGRNPDPEEIVNEQY